MNSELNSLPWAIFMPLGGVISMILGFKKRKTEKVKTHVDQLLGYMWIAFGVTLAIVLFSQGRLGIENTLPLVMALYGVGTFVSGGALKFKPLIIGGVFCWGLSIISFRLGIENQLLLLATSVVVSYIIPGFILRSRYKNDNL